MKDIPTYATGNIRAMLDAGFPLDRLVPLIPVGAVLFEGGPAMDLDGEQYWEKPAFVEPKYLGKVPGELIQGQWTTRSNWTNRPVSQDEMQCCDAAQASCGLLCGDVFGGLDLDAMDPELAEAWRVRIAQWLSNASHRIGQAPKCMIPFKVSGEPVKKTSRRMRKGEATAVLEIIGSGGQFVLSGLHPATESPYQWQPAIAHADALPILTAERASTIFDDLVSIAEGLGWVPDRKTSAVRGDGAGTSDLAAIPADPAVIEAVMRHLPNSSTMADWVRVGLALKTEMGDAAWPIWKEWSDRWTGGKDSDRFLEKTFEKFDPDGSLSFGTIRQMLSDLNVALPDDVIAAMDADTQQRKEQVLLAEMPTREELGPLPAGAWEIGSKPAPAEPAPAEPAPAMEDYARKENGALHANTYNVHLWLNSSDQWKNCFAFDAFANRAVLLSPIPGSHIADVKFPRPLTDGDYLDAHAWFQGNGFPKISKVDVRDAVDRTVRRNTFEPVQEYLRNLPPTLPGLLDTWLFRFMGVERGQDEALDRYVAQVGRKFLIGAVARAMRPGCQMDTAPIFEGPQGLGKSTGLRALCPNPDWFADGLPDFHSKDAISYIQGKWLTEMAELASTRKSQLEDIRAFLTRQSDKYRPAYDRTEIELPRRCVFAGTTNRTDYLQDAAGERRMLPIKCGQVDVAGIQAHRDALWREAYDAFVSGETWYLDGDVAAYATGQQQDRVEVDPWFNQIEMILTGTDETTTEFILVALGIPTDRQDQRVSRRVVACLKLLGFKRVQIRAGDDRGKYSYVRDV